MLIILSARDLKDYARDKNIESIRADDFNVGRRMLFEQADALGYIHHTGEVKVMKFRTDADKENLTLMFNTLLKRGG